MAHHKSALKRIRQTRKRKLYNRAYMKALKLAIRAVNESKTHEEGVASLNKAYSVLDRVSAKGILHKNNVAHKKSHLSKFVEKLKA